MEVNQSQPSLSLLKEGLQVRLERIAFTAHYPLEIFQKSNLGFTSQSIEHLINHLEVTLIELRHLTNELRWLRWIKAKMEG